MEIRYGKVLSKLWRDLTLDISWYLQSIHSFLLVCSYPCIHLILSNIPYWLVIRPAHFLPLEGTLEIIESNQLILHTYLFKLLKKCYDKESSKYCTFVLISHASKVVLKIFQARLQQCMNRELPDVQAGFRKGRGSRWLLTLFPCSLLLVYRLYSQIIRCKFTRVFIFKIHKFLHTRY